jgi:hypothetical protein
MRIAQHRFIGTEVRKMRVAADDGSANVSTDLWRDVVNLIQPAIYQPEWAPWLRIMMMAVLIFAALLIWRRRRRA